MNKNKNKSGVLLETEYGHKVYMTNETYAQYKEFCEAMRQRELQLMFGK